MWEHAERIIHPADVKIPKPEFKEVMGMQVAYRQTGEGKPVFCIPPWPSSSFVYIPLGKALEKHYKLIAIDMPGWAGNSGGMTLKPTIENYAQITSEFINSFGYKEYSLIGYSFGGIICQILMHEYKHTPKKVIYVSTLHSGDELKQRHKVLLGAYKRVRKLGVKDGLLRFVINKYVTAVLPHMSYFQEQLSSDGSKELLSEYVTDLNKADIDTIMTTVFSVLDKEYIGRFIKKADSLVIYADFDPKFIKSESIEIADQLGVVPVIIDKADHNHFVLDINKSADIILNFLNA